MLHKFLVTEDTLQIMGIIIMMINSIDNILVLVPNLIAVATNEKEEVKHDQETQHRIDR